MCLPVLSWISRMFDLHSTTLDNFWAQFCTLPPLTATAWRTVWTLSLVTSALFVCLSTCLSTLSLQINNKANVVTSPKEPVPTPSLVHCLSALLPACLHDCLTVYLSWLCSYVELHAFPTLSMVIVFFHTALITTDVFNGCVTWAVHTHFWIALLHCHDIAVHGLHFPLLLMMAAMATLEPLHVICG